MTEQEAEAAGPALLDALKDQDPEVRRSAAYALQELGGVRLSVGSAAAPALIDALKDQDGQVRISAAEALNGIGVGAEAAVPALIDALKDEYEVRRSAASALGR